MERPIMLCIGGAKTRLYGRFSEETLRLVDQVCREHPELSEDGMAIMKEVDRLQGEDPNNFERPITLKQRAEMRARQEALKTQGKD